MLKNGAKCKVRDGSAGAARTCNKVTFPGFSVAHNQAVTTK
jgi:hypothetical protein